MRSAVFLSLFAMVLAGCGRSASTAPQVHLAPGSATAKNAPIDESEFSKTIGPATPERPAATLPPQRKKTKAELIEEVRSRPMPPQMKARLLQEIESPHATRVRHPKSRSRASSPASSGG